MSSQMVLQVVNLLANTITDIMSISWEIALMPMPQDLPDD